ncbi:hypothetical protein PI87_27710 [Ralstonia sp. A12]|uniref:winged helix-turn-helix domain-containing protein n=1 Tax=Ralstonia sp. A12 TaxID=1217052 RepID=UPI000575213D|nr:winged helix-turn-helix domain-containing protein [Ralstonia sp. A12]KHK48670.1 hypothetical protein PI87_27710 [Ralstonia sp. A12]
MSNQILLLDEDQAGAELISSAVRIEGMRMQRVNCPARALAIQSAMPPDVLLIGWAGATEPLLDLLRSFRTNAAAQSLPIVVLSVHCDPATKIAALDAGADDYLVKPCHTGELVARIRVLLRRTARSNEHLSKIGGLVIDHHNQNVMVQAGRESRALPLSPQEFRLLHFLVEHPECVHTREQLLRRVWGGHIIVGIRTVDVHVRKLRMVLAGTSADGLIQTVRGRGYRLVTQP